MRDEIERLAAQYGFFHWQLAFPDVFLPEGSREGESGIGRGDGGMAIESYRDLRVWQAGMELAEECYRLTQAFPRAETFGMTSQIRRAAASIPANVAEGWGRGSRREYSQFLRIAQGSLKELETHLLLATRVGLCPEPATQPALATCDDLGRMLRSLIHELQPKP